MIQSMEYLVTILLEKKVEYKEPDFREVLGKKGCEMIVEAYPWFYELFEYEK